MAKNQRRCAQEALFSTTPPDEEKAVERTESALNAVPAASPADIIREEYGIAANCTNVPQILRAILCEMVRGRS